MSQKDLTNALNQICHDLKTCNDVTQFFSKYDIPLGSKDGHLSMDSIELPHALTFAFEMQVTHEEILKELPEVCKQLGMNLLPLTNANSTSRTVSGYCIEAC